MEYEKIIFFRNLLFRALAIGIAFAVFYFVVTFAFWNTWIPWGAHLYKTDEKGHRDRDARARERV
jgi:hypothetical protein